MIICAFCSNPIHLGGSSIQKVLYLSTPNVSPLIRFLLKMITNSQLFLSISLRMV